MAKLAVIFGGSGFVGSTIAERLARQGWRVRVAVRRPNEALHVKTSGVVGQVEPIFCNIRDDASVEAAMTGADVAINCVGVLNEVGKNTFDEVQHEGAERIARIAAAHQVKQLVHLSAIGADAESDSAYFRSKGQGEAGILAHFPAAVILRPSVIFGPEDGFFNKFAAMSRLGPVLALVGGDTRFQPVYVADVASAAVMGAEGTAAPGVYELGGPEADTLRAWVKMMLGVIHRRRLVVNLPFAVGSVIGWFADMAQFASFGLVTNGLLTRDQVKTLRQDNVVSADAKGFANLGIAPVAAEAVMPDYLWRYRPQGQYDDITASAKNLRP